MASRARRRPILLSVGGGALLLLLAALAVGWYAFGEERRTGRLVARLLSRELGVPVRIERATASPAGLTLRGISVPPGAHWGGSLAIRELRVEGGVLPVVFPRGRTLSVTAVSTSVTLARDGEPLALPASDTLETLRRGVLRLLDWPGAVSLELKGGELRSAEGTLAFDLAGEKSLDGKLALRLSLRRAEGPAALALDLVGTAAAGDLRVGLRARAEPGRLGSLWPATLPALASLDAELDLALTAAPELDLSGRLGAVPAGESPVPLAASFSGRYRPRAARADLAAFALDWGPGFRLELSGSAEDLETAPRLTVAMAGRVDGGRLTGEARYAGATGALGARLGVEPFATAPLLERLGYRGPALQLSARRSSLSLDGRVEGDGVRLEGKLGLEDVAAPGWVEGQALRADLAFRGTHRRADGRGLLAGLESAEFRLASPAGPVAVVTAVPARGAVAGASFALEGRAPDLSRLAVLPGAPLKLAGEAWLSATLTRADSGWSGGGPLTLNAPVAVVDVGSPLTISGLRLALPLAWGTAGDPPDGSISAESLTLFGFVLRQLASPARFREGALSLPALTYRHYGGSGAGWLEARPGEAVPLRLRLEGEGVDLKILTHEYGLTVGRITGTLRYLLVAQYSGAGGLVAGGHAASDPPGGEVSIEPLKQLLAYAGGDPTGILQRTLESLSVFSYESLSGDIRVGREGGRVSLSLEGKKRLGIFPGPVRAINFQNVPLSLLVRTFGQPRRDSP
jgi:hypothetical protein